MKAPDCIDLTPEQIEGLISRLENQTLQPDDFPLLADLLRAVIWMGMALREKELSIQRLRKVFGIKTESAKKLMKWAKGKASSQQPSSDHDKKGKQDPKKKGHGHRPSSDYREAKIIPIAHEALKKGAICPDCLKGRLFNLSAGTLIRIVGQPWLEIQIYKPERLRCPVCGKTFTAKLPEEACVGSRSDEAAKAVVSLLKYRGGVPFYRQEKIQSILGSPLSACEIFEMTESVADCAQPIFALLCRIAAQAECIHNDDTSAKILDLIKEKENGARKGIFTTAILAKHEGKQLALFFTGRRHAGENLDHLLEERAPDIEAPIQACDGLSRNIPERHPTQVGKCNAHARRKFYELVHMWPKEAVEVVSGFDLIFLHDRIAKQSQLDPEARLKLHIEQSLPIMDRIKSYCNELLETKKVEPNSSLGKAINYLNNHWEGLTLFLRIPGVPLSNNDCENLIKRSVLNRKNAYFFRTEAGARIADVQLSVIETCVLNQVNPWDYLIAIQKNRELVFKEPQNWLPWNYPKAI